MSTWLIYSLIGLFFWSFTYISDTILRRKYIQDDITLTWYGAITDIPFFIILLIIGGIPTWQTLPGTILVIAGFLSIAPLILVYKALEFEDPSKVALYFQILPIFTLIIGYLFINETLVGNQIIGFIIILSGGFIAALEKKTTKIKISKALWLIMLVCAMFAIGQISFKYSEPQMPSFIQAFTWYYIGRMLFPLLVLISKKQRTKIVKIGRRIKTICILLLIFNLTADAIGQTAFAYALKLGKASLVSSITGTQPLVIFMISMLFYKRINKITREDISKFAITTKSIALTLTLIGIYLLG
jgi:drug/metabolite transporter (DMT)-like permease